MYRFSLIIYNRGNKFDFAYNIMASAPPSLRGGLKIFGKISKGGPGKFPKFRGGLNLRGGLNDFYQNHN